MLLLKVSLFKRYGWVIWPQKNLEDMTNIFYNLRSVKIGDVVSFHGKEFEKKMLIPW